MDQAARLVHLRRHVLGLGEVGVQRPGRLGGAVQREQRLGAEALRQDVVGAELQRPVEGGQRLGVLPLAVQQPAHLDEVADVPHRSSRRPRQGDGLLEVRPRRRAVLPRRCSLRPALVEGGQLRGEPDRVVQRRQRRVPLPQPLERLGEVDVGLERLRVDLHRVAQVVDRLARRRAGGCSARPGWPGRRSGRAGRAPPSGPRRNPPRRPCTRPRPAFVLAGRACRKPSSLSHKPAQQPRPGVCGPRVDADGQVGLGLAPARLAHAAQRPDVARPVVAAPAASAPRRTPSRPARTAPRGNCPAPRGTSPASPSAVAGPPGRARRGRTPCPPASAAYRAFCR